VRSVVISPKDDPITLHFTPLLKMSTTFQHCYMDTKHWKRNHIRIARYIFKGNEIATLKRHLHSHVHFTIIYKKKDKETTVSKWMDKESIDTFKRYYSAIKREICDVMVSEIS
jgi:hypothetical protein